MSGMVLIYWQGLGAQIQHAAQQELQPWPAAGLEVWFLCSTSAIVDGSASPSRVFGDLQPGQDLPDDHGGEGSRNISVKKNQMKQKHPHPQNLV